MAFDHINVKKTACEELKESQELSEDIVSSEQVLSLFYQAATEQKLLYIDQKYLGCLGCTNINFGSFMYNNFATNERVISAVVLYQMTEDQPTLGKALLREPFNLIQPTDAYTLLNTMVKDKRQKFNNDYLSETYPINVPSEYRDCLIKGKPDQVAYCNEQQALRENQNFKERQAERLFTRHHFPNLLFIDGKKINVEALEQVCAAALNDEIMYHYALDDSHYRVTFKNDRFDKVDKALKSVLDEQESLLLQMLNYNLYLTGTETAEDLNMQGTQLTLKQLLTSYNQGNTEASIELYHRPGYELTSQLR
ncbi:hypothetical protein D1Z90_15050 [Motilimonas pumila]|uniref:Uncharacterized protein n=2 Tax=Motilimonas pumila TaxID=2303987 RepID=A0A418YC51_9GAMM|nr:hypothetical protein D1Z90_15050 [Motilimonas pumila]